MGNLKRKHSQMSGAQAQLKPLDGAQIEAVTKTYNELRASGVHTVVDFPATVVAGDTSSGKSSVMSRLTGLRFPQGEGVVTRFATEVKMMPASVEKISVKILPGSKRPQDQVRSLSRFNSEISIKDFEDTFTQASDIMARFGEQNFYDDILQITLNGPKCPPLTLIDLPGLMQASDSKFSDGDRILTEELAKRYIKQNRTIVLTVVTASNEVVNQAITRLTRVEDPDGKRTMGIVTKVDTVCGSARDRQLLNVLENKKIAFELGWHALVNVIDGEDNATDEQITTAESEFFEQKRFAALKKLSTRSTGIDDLRSRVVQVVGQKLVETLPALRSDVQSKLAATHEDLARLGSPETQFAAQRKALTRLSGRFHDLVRTEVRGGYKTLRSAVDALNADFVTAMRAYGSSKRFDGLGPSSTHNVLGSNHYSDWIQQKSATNRKSALAWMQEAQGSCTGSGMSDSVNNNVTPTLFRELSARWADLARAHIGSIADLCVKTIGDDMLDNSTRYTGEVSDSVMDAWIEPHVDRTLQTVTMTIAGLEEDISKASKTYDHRLDELKERKAKEIFAAENINTSRVADTTKVIAATNLAHVLAYYDTELEYWMAAIIKQVVERFVCSLPEALSSDLVMDSTDEKVKEVMTESAKLSQERGSVVDTVKTLEFALGKLDKQIKGTK